MQVGTIFFKSYHKSVLCTIRIIIILFSSVLNSYFRGDDPDYGTTLTIPRLESYGGTDIDAQAFKISPEIEHSTGMQKVPTVEDMLIAYATIPGYVANRDNMRGTWFIESICKVFMKNASDMDIKEMMDEVNQIPKFGSY